MQTQGEGLKCIIYQMKRPFRKKNDQKQDKERERLSHVDFPTPMFLSVSHQKICHLPKNSMMDIQMKILDGEFNFFVLTNYEPLIFAHKVNLDSEHLDRDFLTNA